MSRWCGLRRLANQTKRVEFLLSMATFDCDVDMAKT